MFVKTLSALFVTAAVVSAPAAHAAGDVLNFGLISTDTSTALRDRWQPVLDDMSKATGLTIKPFFASDYAGVIEGMRFNKVQVAWFGNAGAVQAVDRSNGEVFARTTYANGDPGYWSVIVTAKDSPVKSIDEVIKNPKAYSYGAGDPNSTSGYLVPNFYLWIANKINPSQDFKASRSANHEANLMAAMNKQVDVAVTNTETLQLYNDSNKDKGKKWEDSVRVLWKSPIIPTDPIVRRKDLPDDVKKKISDFLLNYGKTPEEQAKLAKLSFGKFEASSDKQLLVIRQLGLAGDKAKLESDTTTPDAEKKTKIAEIDAKLADLDKEIKANQ
ncbi:MAG TPA: phosphonate ABC transporter substrate-binding protein [Bordetella sp.]